MNPMITATGANSEEALDSRGIRISAMSPSVAGIDDREGRQSAVSCETDNCLIGQRHRRNAATHATVNHRCTGLSGPHFGSYISPQGAATHSLCVLHHPHHAMTLDTTEIGIDQVVRYRLTDIVMTAKPIKDIDDNGARLLCRNLNTTAAQFQFRRNFGGFVPHRHARQIIIDAVTLP
jgi:hypothetical protein